MATLHNTRLTTSINMVHAAMGMVINDDDTHDVMVNYELNAIRFSRHDGSKSVIVRPNEISCGESYTVTFKAWCGRKEYTADLQCHQKNLLELVEHIYQYIQSVGLALPDGSSL